jgi:hypothetical protein
MKCATCGKQLVTDLIFGKEWVHNHYKGKDGKVYCVSCVKKEGKGTWSKKRTVKRTCKRRK